MNCHICGKPGADVADPCCAAPDCENQNDFAHFKCLSPVRQREELRWQQEDEESRLRRELAEDY